MGTSEHDCDGVTLNPAFCTAEPVLSDSTSDKNSSDLADITQKTMKLKQELEKVCPVPEKNAANKKEGYEAGSPKRGMTAWVPQTPEIASRTVSAVIEHQASSDNSQDRSRTPSPPKAWKSEERTPERPSPRTPSPLKTAPAEAPAAAAVLQKPEQAPVVAAAAPQPTVAPVPAFTATKPAAAAKSAQPTAAARPSAALPAAAVAKAQTTGKSKAQNWLLYALLGFIYIGALPTTFLGFNTKLDCCQYNENVSSRKYDHPYPDERRACF